MWTEYFRVKGIRRGRVVTPCHGEIDFSRDDLRIETLQELYESDFPYLEITEEGKKELYGIDLEAATKQHDLSETVEAEASPPNRKRYTRTKKA